MVVLAVAGAWNIGKYCYVDLSLFAIRVIEAEYVL